MSFVSCSKKRPGEEQTGGKGGERREGALFLSHPETLKLRKCCTIVETRRRGGV